MSDDKKDALDAMKNEILAALRESAAEAYEDAAQKCDDYANEGMASPIMIEVRSIFIMKAAALRAATERK